jgi:hypothetical protein
MGNGSVIGTRTGTYFDQIPPNRKAVRNGLWQFKALWLQYFTPA